MWGDINSQVPAEREQVQPAIDVSMDHAVIFPSCSLF